MVALKFVMFLGLIILPELHLGSLQLLQDPAPGEVCPGWEQVCTVNDESLEWLMFGELAFEESW